MTFPLPSLPLQFFSFLSTFVDVFVLVDSSIPLGGAILVNTLFSFLLWPIFTPTITVRVSRQRDGNYTSRFLRRRNNDYLSPYKFLIIRPFAEIRLSLAVRVGTAVFMWSPGV